MTVEARITPIWKKQKLLLALLLIGFGAWFGFDGFVGWPKSNERWREHERVKGVEGAWEKLVKERGWSAEVPHREYGRGDIVGQFVMGGVCGTIGLVTLLFWFSQVGRSIRMDGDGVTTATGVRVPFSAMCGVGKKLWESKGIAKVRYSVEGRKGEFVVDDYKFETKAARQILEEIERRLLAK